jgi:hypothetical protein
LLVGYISNGSFSYHLDMVFFQFIKTFMTMAITTVLDGAIINPLDKKMMLAIIAAEAWPAGAISV